MERNVTTRKDILEYNLSYLRKGLKTLCKDTTIPIDERILWVHAVQPVIKMWKAELAVL